MRHGQFATSEVGRLTGIANQRAGPVSQHARGRVLPVIESFVVNRRDGRATGSRRRHDRVLHRIIAAEIVERRCARDLSV